MPDMLGHAIFAEGLQFGFGHALDEFWNCHGVAWNEGAYRENAR